MPSTLFSTSWLNSSHHSIAQLALVIPAVLEPRTFAPPRVANVGARASEVRPSTGSKSSKVTGVLTDCEICLPKVEITRTGNAEVNVGVWNGLSLSLR